MYRAPLKSGTAESVSRRRIKFFYSSYTFEKLEIKNSVKSIKFLKI